MSNADQFDAIDTLQAALADGALSLGQHTELQRLVCCVPEARRCYIRLVHQHATLLRLLAAEREGADTYAARAIGFLEGKGVGYILPERPEGCFAQNVPDPFSLCRWTREYFSQPGPLSILAATIFMVCLFSILNILPAPSYEPSNSNHACTTTSSTGFQPVKKDVDGKLKLVARITGIHNCRWSAEGRAPHGYDHLGLGRELKLDAGLLEITYYNGAKLVLEGKVEFTVEKPNACRLDVGKLTAKVSKSAVGLTVETPIVTIVDLGTEFGVMVGEKGVAEVHVFDGQVLAQVGRRGGAVRKTVRLSKNEAMRFDAKGQTKLVGNRNAFPSANAAAFARLSTYATGFEKSDNPDYTAGNTIVGVDGWAFRGGHGNDNHKVISSTVNSGSQALGIIGGASASCTRDFNVVGNYIVIDAHLAMDAPATGDAWAYFLDGTAGYVLQFGFSDGKLAYRGYGDIKTLDHDFVPGNFYHYKATADINTGLWDLSITSDDDKGLKPINIAGIDFRDNPFRIDAIDKTRMYNGASGATFYVDDISIVGVAESDAPQGSNEKQPKPETTGKIQPTR